MLGLFVLAACSATLPQEPLAPERLSAVAFRASEAPYLTIVTMINNRTGQGGHSALIVSGSQRVLFDPAGSYRPDYVTEYGDVLYGMTDAQLSYYRSAHARDSHHVVSQKLTVSPEVAERALALVQANGPVGSAFCTNSITSILQQLPGFEDIKVMFFPAKLMAQIEARPGVETDKYYENDSGDVLDGIPTTVVLQ